MYTDVCTGFQPTGLYGNSVLSCSKFWLIKNYTFFLFFVVCTQLLRKSYAIVCGFFLLFFLGRCIDKCVFPLLFHEELNLRRGLVIFCTLYKLWHDFALFLTEQRHHPSEYAHRRPFSLKQSVHTDRSREQLLRNSGDWRRPQKTLV